MSYSLREELKRDGYSKEEEYFYRINRDLIEKKRSELNSKRNEQESKSAQTIHWMKCPKCGSQMNKMNISGIYAEQCAQCHGIFFDREEFETLLESRIPKSFLKQLLNRIRDSALRFDTNWKP